MTDARKGAIATDSPFTVDVFVVADVAMLLLLVTCSSHTSRKS
jgi:hypothetical protein